MKKLTKILFSLILGLCLSVCLVGMTGCDSFIDTTLPESSPEIIEPEIEPVLVIENSFIYCYYDGEIQKDCEMEGYTFNSIGQLVADEEYVELDGNTYYLRNNAISYGYQVIGGYVYYFGTDGAQVKGVEVDGNELNAEGQLVASNIFFKIRNNTYYIINNVIVYNYMILDGSVYYFGDNGVMAQNKVVNGHKFDAEGRLTGKNELVEIEGKTYCVNGVKLVSGMRLSGEHFYYFGEDYAMLKDVTVGEYYFDLNGKLEASEVFVTVEGDTYYLINSKIVYNFLIINGNVYFFGDDGIMAQNETVDGYFYGADGYLVGDKVFITIENNTYYLLNNYIAKDYQVVEGNVYYFGLDGVMVKDANVDEYYFDELGKLVADKIFITIAGKTYYIVNNVTVYGYKLIGVNVYYFAEDGVMMENGYLDGYYFSVGGKLSGSNFFITVENNTYYIINSVIVYNYHVIDGSVYYFGEDGVMVKDVTVEEYYFGIDGKLVADKIFFVIDGKTYYIVNNAIVKGYYIIDENVYYFDGNGVMVQDGYYGDYEFSTDGTLVADKLFIDIAGKTYYIVNNEIVYNYQIIGGNVYYFGTDGAMLKGNEFEGLSFGADGKLVANEIFLVIENNTYYVINNVIVYNYYVINGSIYFFGDDGAMRKDELVGEYPHGNDGFLLEDNGFVTVGGKTYYLIDNVIVNGYKLVGENVYYFGDDGVMAEGGYADGKYFDEDGKLTGTNVLVTIGNATYCISGNVRVKGYHACNGYIYYFGDDYAMVTNTQMGDVHFGADGKLDAGNGFLEIEGNTYYVENTLIVYNYHIIDGHVYYFGDDGIMRKDTEIDGLTISPEGYVTSDYTVTIVIGGKNYWIMGETVTEAAILTGKVTESDNDLNPENNPVLANVTCSAVANGETFVVYTNSAGVFTFDNLPYGEVTITFSRSGYHTASVDAFLSEDIDLSVVLDRAVSNKLTGKVTKADSDTNATNNSALANATITLTRTTSTNEFTRTTTTNSSGIYTFEGLTAGVYTMTITCNGYISITQTVYVRYNDTTIQNVTIEAISTSNVADGYAAGTITDARTGKSVSGISVIIRAGLGNTYGEILYETVTSSSGYYTTKALKPGNYTAQLVDKRSLSNEKERYSSIAFEIKVLSNMTISNQNATISNSVGISADSIRIVLTWGSSPSDLDSWLYVTPRVGSQYYISYQKYQYDGSRLDVDDTSSYGPETITISNVNDGNGRVYKYYVHDYSNRNSYSSTALSRSGAKVQIYFGSVLAYTVYVPSGSGTCWHIFTYDSATGDFQLVNKISNSKGY